MSNEQPKCELCGEPMPTGEEMFKFHGYSGPCPGPPLERHGSDQDEIGSLRAELSRLRADVERKDEALLSDEMIEVGRKAVEDVVIDYRDRRVSMLNVGNGVVCREKDGRPSDIIRLATREAIRIALRAITAALADSDTPKTNP